MFFVILIMVFFCFSLVVMFSITAGFAACTLFPHKACRVCKSRASSLEPRPIISSAALVSQSPSSSPAPPRPAADPHPRPVHFCPFSACAQSKDRGSGWLTPRELVLHLNSVHLSCFSFPAMTSSGILDGQSARPVESSSMRTNPVGAA